MDGQQQTGIGFSTRESGKHGGTSIAFQTPQGPQIMEIGGRPNIEATVTEVMNGLLSVSAFDKSTDGFPIIPDSAKDSLVANAVDISERIYALLQQKQNELGEQMRAEMEAHETAEAERREELRRQSLGLGDDGAAENAAQPAKRNLGGSMFDPDAN